MLRCRQPTLRFFLRRRSLRTSSFVYSRSLPGEAWGISKVNSSILPPAVLSWLKFRVQFPAFSLEFRAISQATSATWRVWISRPRFWSAAAQTGPFVLTVRPVVCQRSCVRAVSPATDTRTHTLIDTLRFSSTHAYTHTLCARMLLLDWDTLECKRATAKRNGHRDTVTCVKV